MRLMKFPRYWQGDERWKYMQLGQRSYHDDGTLITIGSDGCVLCSLASALGMEPPEVNRKLMLANQFHSANIFINSTNYKLAFGGALQHVYQSRWYEDPVPEADMDTLRSRLRQGQPAILCLDSRPDMEGRQYHYVLATGVSDTGGIIVNDSWYNTTDVLSQINRVWYKRLFRGIYGKTDAEAIWRMDFLALEAV